MAMNSCSDVENCCYGTRQFGVGDSVEKNFIGCGLGPLNGVLFGRPVQQDVQLGYLGDPPAVRLAVQFYG